MDAIVILASLGRLKAYRIEQTPTRGKKLSLIEDMEFIDAHGGLSDHLSDRSGRFPKIFTAGPPHHSHLSAYEAQTVELEIQRRLFRDVGEAITAILRQERPEGWYFAAGSEHHDAILSGIAPDLRDRMIRGETVDIVNEPPQAVLQRFLSPWGK